MVEKEQLRNQISYNIGFAIFEYEPSVGIYYKLKSLNKKYKQFFSEQLQMQHIPAIYYRDRGNVSKRFIRKLFQYLGHSLTTIDFEFSHITDEHFEKAQLPETLLTLNLNGCREISEKTLVQISKQCPKLKRIGMFCISYQGIEFYWNCRITDFGMKKIAAACKDLEYVNLSGCKYLSDSSITALSENCPNIYHFNLTRIPKLSDKPFKLIAKLQHLDNLNLYADADIQDQGFKDLALSPYHNLTFLDLCGCKYLSDTSVVELTKNFPKLTYLNLTWCVSLTDASIVDGVSKYLTKLNLLSLYGLVKISDATVDALVQSPLKFTLETLDINGCKDVSQGDEESMKKLFPNVKVLIYHS